MSCEWRPGLGSRPSRSPLRPQARGAAANEVGFGRRRRRGYGRSLSATLPADLGARWRAGECVSSSAGAGSSGPRPRIS